MKTKNLFILIVCLSVSFLVHAREGNEKAANLNAAIQLMEVSDKNINITCWTEEEFASRIRTTGEELNRYIRDLFQAALEDTRSKTDNTSLYFLELNQYDVTASGYPYNNFQHSIHYVIYDEEMNQVVSDSHRFVTFSNVSAGELTKQFKKVSRKIVSNLHKK
ncbi:MAG: hypothetical protein LUE93_05750 [Bacteroides sp.]|nr:hypothetical protein [Bacteroides sp.]